MAPVLFASIRRWVTTVRTAQDTDKRDIFFGSSDGPLADAARLLARTTAPPSFDPSEGVLDPHDIKNVGFFVLFAMIGVAFVVTGIWFFFWAKHGGFHFKENDWDDYKSTVLRRKGPNGTLLSGATPSTNLGGGSVYQDVVEEDGRTEEDLRTEEDGRTVVTESTALSGITAGASDIAAREARRKKQEQREKRKKERNTSSSTRHVGEDGVEDVVAEKEAKKQLRNYRHEKPARVGGLNKESESSAWDASTNPTASEMTTSSHAELLGHRQSTPTSTPTGSPVKAGGIRKVYSTADRTPDRETERVRAEARRLREAGRAATAASSSSPSSSGVSRRDFSYQRAAATGEGTSVSESLLSGSGSELGTKSYHHPMPELREQRAREREERRARRGGYRRGATDEI